VNALNADQRAECAVIAVGFTGLLSLFNIGGRFVWAVLSDSIGRKNTFHCIFILGITLYALLPTLIAHGNLILFIAGLCVLMSMFGGAFAVVPAYLSDLFGSEMISAIQGRVLTAWSTAGVIGPLLIGAIRDSQLANGVDLAHAYDPAFYVIAGLLLVGLVCNACVRPVPDRCFMSPEELERHRHGSRYDGPEPRSAENTVEIGFPLTATVASAWLAVCIPIGWGICMTVVRAAVLL
jgi:MFS family permease